MRFFIAAVSGTIDLMAPRRLHLRNNWPGKINRTRYAGRNKSSFAHLYIKINVLESLFQLSKLWNSWPEMDQDRRTREQGQALLNCSVQTYNLTLQRSSEQPGQLLMERAGYKLNIFLICSFEHQRASINSEKDYFF